MTIRLSDVAAKAPFPLFAVNAGRWKGDRFVGDVSRDQSGVVGAVSIVYMQGFPPDESGFAVSSIDPNEMRWHEKPGWEPIDFHLAHFVARFDRQLLMKRFRQGRNFDPFRLEDFTESRFVTAIAGESLGAIWYRHRFRPLQLLRAVVRRGDAMTDLGVAAWNQDAREMAAMVEQVDARFAHEFDALVDPTYPPPEWSEPGSGG